MQNDGVFTRETILELIERNTKLLDSPEVREQVILGSKNGRNAEDIVSEIQNELMISMGIEPDVGIGLLGGIRGNPDSDVELVAKFCEFVAKEESLVEEATLPEDIFAQRKNEQLELTERQRNLLKLMRTKSATWEKSFLETAQNLVHDSVKQQSDEILECEFIQELLEKHFEVSRQS